MDAVRVVNGAARRAIEACAVEGVDADLAHHLVARLIVDTGIAMLGPKKDAALYFQKEPELSYIKAVQILFAWDQTQSTINK